MKSKSFVCVMALLLVLVPAFARGSHEPTGAAAPNELQGFSRVDVTSGITVDIKQAKEFSVKATGPAEAVANLDLRVRGETLHISTRHGLAGAGVAVSIAMPALEFLTLSRGSAATIDFDAVKTPTFKLVLSGGSRLSGVLLANNLVAELSGGSQAAIEGYGNDFIAQISGGSRFDCRDWAVDKAVMDLSGGARAVLAVQTALTVDASGGARLEYRGKPRLTSKVSGGAAVLPLSGL